MKKGVSSKVIWFVIALVIMVIILVILTIFVLKRGQGTAVSFFGSGFLDPLLKTIT